VDLEERGLEGVFRHLGVAQVVAEVVVQLRLVPMDQFLEGLAVPLIAVS
jgi:hypothetical protein